MRKVVYIGVILFIIGLLGASIMVYKNMGLETEAPFKHEKKVDAGNTKNVIVKSNSVDIEVYPSQNNQLSAVFTGSKQKTVVTDLQLSTQGNTVEIEAKREETSNRSWIHFNLTDVNQPTKVAVYLPKKQYESLTLQTSHGDIQLKEFKGKNAKATTQNGDIVLQNVNAILTLQTNHGDINLSEQILFHGNNLISTSTGDIAIRSGFNPTTSKERIQGQLSLQTSHGDIDLNGYQGSMLTTHTDSGDINLQNIDTTFTARSKNGDINIQSIVNFYGKNQVDGSNGDIQVSVGHDPKSLNVNFIGTNVQSDFPIGTTFTSNGSELKGIIGTNSANAPTLNMQTQNGEVLFSR